MINHVLDNSYKLEPKGQCYGLKSYFSTVFCQDFNIDVATEQALLQYLVVISASTEWPGLEIQLQFQVEAWKFTHQPKKFLKTTHIYSIQVC